MIRSAADVPAREVTERSIEIEATTGAGAKTRMAGRLYVDAAGREGWCFSSPGSIQLALTSRAS